jgi:phosphoglycerate dehydrogenase-like enzyme
VAAADGTAVMPVWFRKIAWYDEASGHRVPGNWAGNRGGVSSGTIGLGNIAKETIYLLRPFGMARFLAFDPYAPGEKAVELGVELIALNELLRLSDYVLVNCPVTRRRAE